MKIKILVAALATLVTFPAAVQAQLGERRGDDIRVTATGRVEAVRPDGGFTFTANRQTFTVYRPNAGGFNTPELRRVRAGDRVRVVGELTEQGRIAAQEVEVLAGGGIGNGGIGRQGRVLSGSIRNINAEERRMSLATPEGLVRVEWDEETEFVRNRVRGGIREFRVGDSVRVIGRRGEEGVFTARRVLIGGTPGWENNAVGEIVSLNARSRTAEVDFDGQVETVNLANATIRRIGGLGGGRRLDIEDLRLDQEIRVQGTRTGARGPITASVVEIVRGSNARDDDRRPTTSLSTYEGTVETLFPNATAFRLRRTTNETIRVNVDASTEVVRGANPASFSALRADQRVRVRGRLVTGANGNEVIEAERVEIVP